MSRLSELLIYPLIVGLVVAFFSYGLPKLTEKKKKITFSVEQPISYISPDKTGDIEVKIGGVPIKYLHSYTVKIENVGNSAVSDLPISYIFKESSDNFKILDKFHRTVPEFEFGAITEIENDSVKARFNYELLNPEDIVNLTFLTTGKADLQVYAKKEEMSFEKAEEKGFFVKYGELSITMFGAIGALLSLLTKNLFTLRMKGTELNISKDEE